MRPSVIHQDNQSAMLLETNGRESSGKRTRHMNIRYFFVADCQHRGHVTVRYCPTDEMIGDFFTKPLGGAKFRRFRNIIMNCDHDEFGAVNMDELMAEHEKRIMTHGRLGQNEPTVPKTGTAGSQECVGARSNHMWAAVRVAHKNNKKPLLAVFCLKKSPPQAGNYVPTFYRSHINHYFRPLLCRPWTKRSKITTTIWKQYAKSR